MRIAVLETSGSTGEAAVAEDGAILARRDLPSARQHARDLVPALKDLLAEVGWRPADLELIVTTLGPGSYTGLRVGLMTAKTLAFATGAGLIGVDVMTALAEQAPADATAVWTIVDAQQANLYVARFERKPEASAPVQLGEIRVLPAQGWLTELTPTDFVLGPAVPRLEQELAGRCRVAAPGLHLPRAEAVLAVGRRAAAAGRRDDFWSLEPLYLRASSAEVKWRAREGQQPSS